MPTLGVTGGIATGKTTFVRVLLACLPAAVFDADACARDLLANDDEVRERVRERFGDDVFGADGRPDRARLRDLVFRSDAERRALEAILHPLVRARWTAQAREHASTNTWFIVDIPLLFETDAASFFHRVVVVACSAETQRARLRKVRGLADELADQIVAAQMSLTAKIEKADHVVWNDSTEAVLAAQAALLTDWLRQRYG